MKVRNPFAGLLALFFVVAWCLSGSAAFAKPLVPLRTAWLGEHETFLVWYAREKGWDKAEGLDLELLPFESGKNVIDEMQSSNWAIAGVGAMPALTASLSSRLYIVGIGNDESASNAIFTRADSPILKMKGFNPNCPEVYGNPGSVRGKTFIVPKGTSAHYMLSRWLHVLGLNERDVNIVDMQPSEAMKAFADGQGDAIALWAPQTFEAEKLGGEIEQILLRVLATPVSPELLPPDENGNIKQKTEDKLGPYEVHDFYLYYFLRFGTKPQKLLFMASRAFSGKYSEEQLKEWLRLFIKRFFISQFKRSCLPDGPKVGSVSLSPRGDFRMPSDAEFTEWLKF